MHLSAFVESTIKQVVSRRFVKKQPMQWTLSGAHLLLQTRTKVLNGELHDVFRRWYPKFRPQPQTPRCQIRRWLDPGLLLHSTLGLGRDHDPRIPRRQ
jgi:hypothetical protein